MYRDQSSTIHVLVKKRKNNSVDFYFFASHFKKNGFENAKKKRKYWIQPMLLTYKF